MGEVGAGGRNQTLIVVLSTGTLVSSMAVKLVARARTVRTASSIEPPARSEGRIVFVMDDKDLLVRRNTPTPRGLNQ